MFTSAHQTKREGVKKALATFPVAFLTYIRGTPPALTLFWCSKTFQLDYCLSSETANCYIMSIKMDCCIGDLMTRVFRVASPQEIQLLFGHAFFYNADHALLGCQKAFRTPGTCIGRPVLSRRNPRNPRGHSLNQAEKSRRNSHFSLFIYLKCLPTNFLPMIDWVM